MSQRGRETSLEQRVEIGERWAEGQSDPEIAATMNLSPETVRKWRRKYQRQGRAGLNSAMGRPARGVLSQFPVKVRMAVKEMRRSHPGWGPLTLRTELELDNSLNKLSLPSRARIAAFLKEQKLSRKYEHHSPLPQAPTVQPQRAHEEWEVDAQGAMKVADLGKVSIINIADLFSRVKIDSCPVSIAPIPTLKIINCCYGGLSCAMGYLNGLVLIMIGSFMIMRVPRLSRPCSTCG